MYIYCVYIHVLCIDLNSVPFKHRPYSRGSKGPILHGSVRPGTHKASRHPAAAVVWALLSRLHAHPQDRAGSILAVPPVRHPGSLQEGDLCGGEWRHPSHRGRPGLCARQDGEWLNLQFLIAVIPLTLGYYRVKRIYIFGLILRVFVWFLMCHFVDKDYWTVLVHYKCQCKQLFISHWPLGLTRAPSVGQKRAWSSRRWMNEFHCSVVVGSL